MIYVLHGENTKQSYLRLKTLSQSVKKEERVRLSNESGIDDLYLSLFTQNLVEDKKLIVCENFFSTKKIKTSDKILSLVPRDKTLIFWETSSLDSEIVSHLSKTAEIETFKPEPKLFWFLDSVSPNSKISLSKLENLDLKDKDSGLIHNLLTRVLLLILAKYGLDQKTAATISGLNLQTWQWSKIISQSQKFSLQNLTSFFNGALKVDMITKTGVSSLSESTLTSFLLIKYLKV